MNLQHQTLQVKKYDHDRYLCCLFAKEKNRDQLLTILAFNSEIALISEQTSDLTPALIRITWWQDAIDDLYQGKIRQHSLIIALEQIITEHKIPQHLFSNLLQARMIELYQQPPSTTLELIKFAEKTGGNLLEICAYAIDSDNFEQYKNIGTAWSLIGILRATKYLAQTRKPLLFPTELIPKNFKIGDDNSRIITKIIINEAQLLLNKIDRSVFCKSTAALDLLYYLNLYYIKLIKQSGYNILNDKLSFNPVFKQLYLLYQFLKLTA